MSSKHPLWGSNAGVSKSITKITDGTLGTPGDALVEITASYAEATIANSLATLAAKVNALIDVLESHGITDTTGDANL